ncbi:MAG: HNH endonuclease [Clostridiales bacterium]|nr:HNH endonuclease [Clostridiales bacterium]
MDNLQGHHIKSFKEYPELRLDEENVAVLCQTCNLQVGGSSIKDW